MSHCPGASDPAQRGSFGIWTIKSFGPFGPKYQVGSAIRPLADGDWMIEITLIRK